MAASFLKTARNALRYMLGTDNVSDVDEGFLRLAEDVDTRMASWWVGTKAERLALAVGQPNRFFRESDTGAIYHDTGAAWERVLTREVVTTAIGSPVGTVSTFSGTTINTPIPIILGTPYTPSATRPTVVYLIARRATAALTKVAVGGVTIMEGEQPAFGNEVGYLFIVPAGQSFTLSGTADEAKAFYQTL